MTPDQLHYLSNDVYKTARTEPISQESHYGDKPGGAYSTAASIPVPGEPNRMVHASWHPGISEANPSLGLPRPHGIILDTEILHDILTELTADEEAAWHDAVNTITPRRVLWTPNMSKGKLYWRPNPHLPALAPPVGLKITSRLLEYRLIIEAPEHAHEQLKADRGQREPTMLEIIEQALQRV